MASRSGSSSGGGIVEFDGLPEFRKALRNIGPDYPKELRTIHKEIAVEGAARAQSVARGMGGQQRKFAKGIKGRANQREARIGVGSGKSTPGANAAFWGAKSRYGWYGFRRYHPYPTTPQFRPWVGNSWDAAKFSEGPYAINPALAQYLPRILEKYIEMIDELAKRAFPEGRN